jgi:hypothetical protein
MATTNLDHIQPSTRYKEEIVFHCVPDTHSCPILDALDNESIISIRDGVFAHNNGFSDVDNAYHGLCESMEV